MAITLQEGDKAPAFTGKDQDGNKLSLRGYQGKKLVLFFYPESGTPTCTVEACNLRDHFSALREKGFEVLGVSPDTTVRQKKFEQQYKLPYRLLADENHKVAEKYGVRDWKIMFGHRYIGILRTTFVLDEKGVILKIFRRPRNKAHAEEILAALP